MKCLNCPKEFEPKRKDTAKFCSATCRVQYNRVNPKEKVTRVQMQVLYNTMMERLGQIEFKPPTGSSFDGKKLDKITYDEPGQWQEPKPLTFKAPKSAAQYLELKRECETADQWQELWEEINSSHLSFKEKQILKTAT